MSEFNTGKPPAGEAGMLILRSDSGSLFFKAWDGSHFGPSKYMNGSTGGPRESIKLISQDAFGVDADESWRFATLAELTAAGIPESEARGMVHKSMLADAPWLPPQQDGFGPWVECDGSCHTVADGHQVIARLIRMERSFRQYLHTPGYFDGSETWIHVAAYCVKLEAKPAIAATCAPPSEPAPEDEAAMNAAMIDRDMRGPAEKPQAAAVAAAEPAPWHLRCAPWTNRFGGWGA